MANALDQMMRMAMAQRFSRRGFFKGPVVAGAGALAFSALGGGLGTFSVAAGPLDSDLEILNYALTLEHLESAAYKAVNSLGILTGRAATYFQAFGAHEATHVDAVTAAIKQLGGTPVQPATYNFSSVPKDQAGVVAFFQNVEAVGASAYLGAAPSIKNFDILEAALSIHAVEAEHAAAFADLVSPGSSLFAPDAFAMARTPDQVMQIVAPFFAAAPPTSGAGTGSTGPVGSGAGSSSSNSPGGTTPTTSTAGQAPTVPGANFIRRLGDG